MRKFLVLVAAAVVGCSSAAATPIVVYVTLAPTLAASSSPAPSSTITGSVQPTAKPPVTPVPKPTLKPPPTPKPTPEPVTFDDGQYEVGTDIAAGTYRTREGSDGCYWARLKGFSGDLEDIAANDNTDDPAVVTIAKSDAGFEAERCATWTNDLSQITSSKTAFGPGTYIVGTDIAPGRYRNSGGDGCYWARLKNFAGGIGGIIANDNTNSSAIVTISASDKGFSSTRCGTWTRH